MRLGFWQLAVTVGAVLISTQIASAQQSSITSGSTYGVQHSDPMFHGGRQTPNVPDQHQVSEKARALLELREEGLRLRDGDGGTLTEEHRAYLQGKLDAIQAKWPVESGDQN